MSRRSVTTVTVTCDRCGIKAEGGFQGGGTFLHSESSFRFKRDYGSDGGANVRDFDLCAVCSEGFFTFMTSGVGVCQTAPSGSDLEKGATEK